MGMDVLQALRRLDQQRKAFDIIFMDPPYRENLTKKTVEKISLCNILSDDGVIICEHGKYEKMEDTIGEYVKSDEREYNRKIVTFYKKRKW